MVALGWILRHAIRSGTVSTRRPPARREARRRDQWHVGLLVLQGEVRVGGLPTVLVEARERIDERLDGRASLAEVKLLLILGFNDTKPRARLIEHQAEDDHLPRVDQGLPVSGVAAHDLLRTGASANLVRGPDAAGLSDRFQI